MLSYKGNLMATGKPQTKTKINPVVDEDVVEKFNTIFDKLLTNDRFKTTAPSADTLVNTAALLVLAQVIIDG